MIMYFAFLRAINIGGKNKIEMSVLKQGVEGLAFSNVRTYLNSGNVVFASESTDIELITERITEMIRQLFQLEIAVTVYPVSELKRACEHAPSWWGNDDPEIYSNMILMMPGYGTDELLAKLGPLKEELEWAEVFENVIFWSFKRRNYAKTNWWPRTAMAGIGEMITIRTAGTVGRMLSKATADSEAV